MPPDAFLRDYVCSDNEGHSMMSPISRKEDIEAAESRTKREFQAINKGLAGSKLSVLERK